MSNFESTRHSLPYLSVAQASKEITHNEALVRIDALLHPVVEGQSVSPPSPTLTDSGKCWVVSDGASGDWQGRDNHIALWTGGSWRFQMPTEGMVVRNRESATNIIWSGTGWILAPAISDPQSGAVVDIEARSAIATILSYLRSTGQVANQ